MQAELPPPNANCKALELAVRAAFGRAMCTAGDAKQRDGRVSVPTTLEALLASLATIQAAMQLILAQPSEVSERLYWLVLNGTLHMFAVAEPLMWLGYSAKVAPFLAWCILAMEAVPQLQTQRYLPWRLRLYATASRAYEDAGNATAATAVCQRAKSAVERLRRELEQDPPIAPEVDAVLQKAHLRVAQLAFRFHASSNSAAAIADLDSLVDFSNLPLDDTVDVVDPTDTAAVAVCAAMDAVAAAKLSWQVTTVAGCLRDPSRRVLRHAPPAERDHSRVTMCVDKVFELLGPFMDAMKAAWHGAISVEALEATRLASAVPIKVHVSLVYGMYSYQQWDKVQVLLPAAEMRVMAATAADCHLLRLELALVKAMFELEQQAATPELPEPSSEVLAAWKSVGEDLEEDLAVIAAGGTVDASARRRRKRGKKKAKRKGVTIAAPPDAGDDDSQHRSRPARKRRSGARAFPVPDVPVLQLQAAARAISEIACRAQALCHARPDMIVDAALQVWAHTDRLVAWLEARPANFQTGWCGAGVSGPYAPR